MSIEWDNAEAKNNYNNNKQLKQQQQQQKQKQERLSLTFGAVVVGLVTSYIFIGLFLVAILVYWLLQLIDLYKQIHRMEVVKT